MTDRDPALSRLRAALRQRERELAASEQEVAALHREIEDTNRGLIALHAELDDAREAEARLAAIVQASGDAMFSITVEGVVEAWNPAGARVLGYAPSHVVGLPVEMLVEGEEPPQFLAVLDRVTAGESVQAYDTRWRRRDGSMVDVAVTVSPMLGPENALIGFSTVVHDITSRVRAQSELAAARADQEVMNDRDRIARDLQDMVIQRIFGAGMALEGAASLVTRPEAVAQIEAVIRELDVTIQELRTAIFALHDRPAASAGLRAQILDLATAAQPALGFPPSVRFEGPVDAALPDDVVIHLVAAVREALAHIARHAGASYTEVSLQAGDDLVLRVSENSTGSGAGADDRGAEESAPWTDGWDRLREHAQTLHATFEITPRPGGGSRIEWRIPLSG